ncbi:umecyanin-like [Quercus lobata]|uniref:umecyanin-like n=1 Tax=Quercus lobata TaxID=97700 RepID=UPI0012477E52|nr:umecyanin-like [Quercus lobata]
MAKQMSMTILLVVVLTAVAAVVKVTEAATYVVGDSSGWIVPMNNPTFYTTWTSGKSFSVGDVLVFNFMSNVHDVATVSRADYDACAVDNTLTRETTGPYNYTINSTGTHYIICTVANGGHCLGGQKLSISVGNSTSGTSPASSPTGSSTPSGSPTSPTPTGSPTSPSDSPSSTETPAGSSSASSLAATLPLVFMTIALAFFY